ncbi:hypothetical protein NDU88_008247 [Pleurodeles waltl]|uniref:Uncharacterized protein n=1 Tax=Pleurodeles waltl TaxID=8319 RepID=A0AAV7QS95_PLEWA|nr:hypothetical protein NDU88_008247 [Pleurodeles waltl]
MHSMAGSERDCTGVSAVLGPGVVTVEDKSHEYETDSEKSSCHVCLPDDFPEGISAEVGEGRRTSKIPGDWYSPELEAQYQSIGSISGSLGAAQRIPVVSDLQDVVAPAGGSCPTMKRECKRAHQY